MVLQDFALGGTQSVPCISSRRCILTTLNCVLESRTEAPSLDAHLAESRVLPSTRRNHEGIVRVLPPPPPSTSSRPHHHHRVRKFEGCKTGCCSGQRVESPEPLGDQTATCSTSDHVPSSRSSSWLEKTSSGNKTHHSASCTPTWRKCMRMFHSGLPQEAREKKKHQNSYVSLQLRAENCHEYARNGETNSVCGKVLIGISHERRAQL